MEQKENKPPWRDLIPSFRRPRSPEFQSIPPDQELTRLLCWAGADALETLFKFCKRDLKIADPEGMPVSFLLQLAWDSKAWGNAELSSATRAASLVLIQLGEILRTAEKRDLIETAVEAYHLGAMTARMRLLPGLTIGKGASKRASTAAKKRWGRGPQEKASAWRGWDETLQKDYPFLTERKRVLMIVCLSEPEFGTKGCSFANVRRVLRAKKKPG